MNRRTTKRKRNMSRIFALVFVVSFLAAMPFMAKAVIDQHKEPETPAYEPQEPATQNPENEAEKIPEPTEPDQEADASQPDDNIQEPEQGDDGETQPEWDETQEETEKNESQENWTTVDSSYFDDALFIGDSRTVGLSEYGDLSNADFFATTGMSVYEVRKETVSVPTVGKVTLDQLLSSMTYGKVYLMLGINELGYNFDQTVQKYGELVDYIRQMQPGAVIYIQANMHVTKSRSDTDSIFNNQNIDRFNSAISEFANGEDIFYIDVNELFDDETGNLNQDYTSDNAHVLGKYYVVWCQWLREKVAA